MISYETTAYFTDVGVFAPDELTIRLDIDAGAFQTATLTGGPVDTATARKMDPRTAGNWLQLHVQPRDAQAGDLTPYPGVYGYTPNRGQFESMLIRSCSIDWLAGKATIEASSDEVTHKDARYLGTAVYDTGVTNLLALAQYGIGHGSAVPVTDRMGAAAVPIPAGDRRVIQPGETYADFYESELNAAGGRLFSSVGQAYIADREDPPRDPSITALILSTAPDSQDIYTAWTEQARNLGINPRASAAGVGWTSNRPATWPATRGVVPPVPAPDGIATAVECANNGTESPATNALASLYNVDGLGAGGTVQRSLGVWVLVTEPGYRMSAGAGGLTWPATELPAGEWTWVESLTPVAAGNYATAYIAKAAGVASTTARAYLTGLTVKAGTAAPTASFDGSSTPADAQLERYRWLGAVNGSASVYESREYVTTILTANGILCESVVETRRIDDDYADGLLVRFQYLNGAGTQITNYQTAGAGARRALLLDRDRARPAANLAAQILARAKLRGQAFQAVCPIDFRVRPGVRLTLARPGGTIDLGLCRSVEYRVHEGRMTVNSQINDPIE